MHSLTPERLKTASPRRWRPFYFSTATRLPLFSRPPFSLGSPTLLMLVSLRYQFPKQLSRRPFSTSIDAQTWREPRRPPPQVGARHSHPPQIRSPRPDKLRFPFYQSLRAVPPPNSLFHMFLSGSCKINPSFPPPSRGASLSTGRNRNLNDIKRLYVPGLVVFSAPW